MAVARGDAPADLILARARIVNTFTGEIEEGNVAIYADRIAGVGDYREGREVIDLEGRFLAPGLIDGHTHLESSLLHLAEYARAVVPRGTTALVTDLHEIANVKGLKGLRYMMDCARPLPLAVFFMAPPCVPATDLETAGARITPQEVRAALRWRGVLGLGEVMNFPGVLEGRKEVLEKVLASRGRIVDGHAPGLTGKSLNAYLAAGIGSDHECVSLEEAREKVARGMHIMIREGSSEQNLEALLPLAQGPGWHRCFFVVDDRTAADLLREGDMDAIVRKAIDLGLDPVRAIQMASLNAARYFRLGEMGAIAPGYAANLIVFKEWRSFTVERVFYRGRLVAQEGRPLFSPPHLTDPEMLHSFHIKPFSIEDLALPARGRLWPVIEVVPGQIITRWRDEEARVVDGRVVPDTERDLLKLVVVERHRATGNIGRGLVRGFGLKAGALASSVAHDSHNIVAVGASDEDLFVAIKEVERLQGGVVVARQGRVRGSLALPVAGLLSQERLEMVVSRVEELERLAAGLGCRLPAPLAALSFLALPVIPELRLTDRGLVDVVKGRLLE
ncbi:MAG: adenine deaminase [Chloroflexota bacterium]|nr:adenine deaminase [Chloroflexota bacterium]